jgi:hypothetical protein
MQFDNGFALIVFLIRLLLEIRIPIFNAQYNG